MTIVAIVAPLRLVVLVVPRASALPHLSFAFAALTAIRGNANSEAGKLALPLVGTVPIANGAAGTMLAVRGHEGRS